MDFDQAIELLTALGDFGNLLTGMGDLAGGVVGLAGLSSDAPAAK